MTKTTFADLSLLPKMLTAIDELGFTEPTPVQAESIPIIRTGADILAQSQTGTGKTMAFAIPAVECIDEKEKNVQVLVLSPTRELSQQCGSEIRKLARHLPYVKTADVFGGADISSQFKALKNANFIIGTPGRIMDHMRRGTLKLNHLKMVVLDEADEMLNMGFKEDIETILKDVPAKRQIVLFSATVPSGILAITKQFQNNPIQLNINANQVTLDNIKQCYVDVPSAQKQDGLKLLIHYLKPHHAIIFTNTKNMVDDLAESLSQAGFAAQGLHGDMRQQQRTKVMQAFKQGKVYILVATDVAARGIDVSDIDYVFNYDIPKMSEYYVHRIGRTGRAGRTGTAITLTCGRKQETQLMQLAKRVKSNIEPMQLPTVADIEKSQLQHNIESLEKLLKKEENQTHINMVSSLVELGYTPEHIAATLIGIAFKHSTKGLVDIKPVSKSKDKKSGKDNKSTKASNQKQGNDASGDYPTPKIRNKARTTELYLNIGSSSRVTPNHIVGALSESTGMPAKHIGKINVTGEYTVVNVPADLLDEIIDAMEGTRICGKIVTAMPLVEQPKKKKKEKSLFGKNDNKNKASQTSHKRKSKSKNKSNNEQ